jgi:hypothetical protein
VPASRDHARRDAVSPGQQAADRISSSRRPT